MRSRRSWRPARRRARAKRRCSTCSSSGARTARAGSTATSTARSTIPAPRSWTRAWPKIADAVMSPVLGPQLNELASLITRDNRPSNQGSAYGSGWYGYVDKDLRTLLGQAWAGTFKTRFCGAGDLNACRNSLWAAIDDAGDELARRRARTTRLSGARTRRRADQVPAELPDHDALDQPADVPAGDLLQRAPVGHDQSQGGWLRVVAASIRRPGGRGLRRPRSPRTGWAAPTASTPTPGVTTR